MTRQALRKLVFAFGFIIAVSWLVLEPPSLAAKTIEQIIVVVDNEPYTVTDIQSYATLRAGRQLDVKNLPELSDADRVLLEQFITDKLVGAEVNRLGIKIGDEEIQRYIDQVKRRNNLTGTQLEEALERQGMDIKRYRASIRTEIEKRELVQRQVEGKVDITEGDVERYYQANQKQFMVEEKIHLRHILLPVPEGASADSKKAVLEKAEALRQRILDGADFSQLARQYSEGAGASAGGDIGWIDRQSLLTEIRIVAFSLPVGTVSEPVETSLGIHLLLVEARQPAHPIPLKQVSKKIKEDLYNKAMEERFERWLKTDLRQRHQVDVKLPGFVFRAEKENQSTVDSLMASSQNAQDDAQDRTFLSYLNPMSYIFKTVPAVDESGKPIPDLKEVKFLGMPLFTTESAGDEGEDPDWLREDPESDKSKDSSSSFWDSINPF